MTKEREFLTLDEVETYTGIKKGSLYYYLRTLGIETVKFNLDKRAYISLADANRIKEIKETPWIAGKKSSQKAEKPPLSTTPVQVTKIVTEKAEKRASSRKQKNTRLPDGCMLASKFAEEHGVARPTFIDHMTKGLGQGLIGTHTDTIPERDRVHYSERVKPNRPKEKEKYLTSEQQHGALEFWKRHDVGFEVCNHIDCWCHTSKNGE